MPDLTWARIEPSPGIAPGDKVSVVIGRGPNVETGAVFIGTVVDADWDGQRIVVTWGGGKQEQFWQYRA